MYKVRYNFQYECIVDVGSIIRNVDQAVVYIMSTNDMRRKRAKKTLRFRRT